MSGRPAPSTALWLSGFLLAGVVGGVAWLLLADPARFEVTAEATILSESGAKGRFGVIVTYVAIAAVASFLWGVVAGYKLRDRGWSMVPLFAVSATLAGIIAWQIGVRLGPPDPTTVNAKVGDSIPQELAIDTVSAFLIWPIFALLALFLVVYSSGDGRTHSSSHHDEVVGH